MKVWIVMYWHCGDCGHLQGIFRTREAAEAHAAIDRTVVRIPGEIEVFEVEVN